MIVCKQLIKCWETKQSFWLSPNSRVTGFGFFCSVTQSCTTICNPMDCNTSGFPALHHLPGFAQSHVHWVSDVIQWSCPLLSPSPPDFRVFSSVLDLHIRWPKYQAFSFSIHSSNEYQDSFPLWLTGLISCSPRDSQESSPTPQFKSINSSALIFLCGPTLTSVYALDFKLYRSVC